jgi:predicted small secreted protein
MKTFSRILLIVAAAMGLASCATARLTTEEKNNLAQAIQTGISEKNFEMEIRMMNPQRGRSRNVSGFSVEVKGDTLVSNLPYFGVVHSAPYGGGKGLNFESKINSYQTTQAKSECTQVAIKTKNEEDNYVYTFDIYADGTAYLTVRSDNRDGISYTGYVSAPSEGKR